MTSFGEPSGTEPWALQFDGHHLALNLTFEGPRATLSPSFFGAQPSSYERDGEEIAPLSGEFEDAVRVPGVDRPGPSEEMDGLGALVAPAQATAAFERVESLGVWLFL